MKISEKQNNLTVAILTTETIHHCYFVKQLTPLCKSIRVFVDEKKIVSPFPFAHVYEMERDQFEMTSWFPNEKNKKLSDISECVYFNDINSEQAYLELCTYNADIVIVFGTRKLSKKICTKFLGKIANLHGGNPQQYRGLDSHLWALYHKDKSGLMTTLHEINPVLDDGNIIASKMLNLSAVNKLCELRKENTEVCVDLVRNFLSDFAKKQKITSYKQTNAGRYYSFMPTVLKEIIYTNFNNGKYNEIFV